RISCPQRMSCPQGRSKAMSRPTWISGRRVTRRTVLASGGVAGTAALAACGGGQSTATTRPQVLPPGELEFWNHWADNTPGGQGWNAVIGKFQTATPGVTVKRVVVASNMLYAKVLAAAS